MESGDDAEFYRLVPVCERAIVSKSDTLGINLQYNIAHIQGSATTNIVANTGNTIGNYYVRFKPNTALTFTNLSSGTSTPSYSNTSFQ